MKKRNKLFIIIIILSSILFSIISITGILLQKDYEYQKEQIEKNKIPTIEYLPPKTYGIGIKLWIIEWEDGSVTWIGSKTNIKQISNWSMTVK